MQHARFLVSLSLLMPLAAAVQAADTAIEEVVVTADLRGAQLLKYPASVTIYNQAQLDQQSISHLEQVLAQSANVNLSSGASRGRFIQIRGIGERSEFIEPTNYSVGVIVDGIDFTGISTAVTSLDVDQIEVLRGPQGTVYGANALAGLINVRSNPVTDQLNADIKADIGEYNTTNVRGFINLPINSRLGLRLAAQNNSSDGYTKNAYLQRDDTANIDETNLRANLQWQASDAFSLNWITFYADADNGYDGFSLDNKRTTLSDQPGTDAQETLASALIGRYQFANASQLIANLSLADSDIEYSYDEDWVYAGFCDGTPCEGWDYSSFDQYLRDNKNSAIDLRYLSAPGHIEWLLGIYYRDQEVDLKRIYTYDSDFQSSYQTENEALYGEVTIALNERLSLTSGLRYENRDADYQDNLNTKLDTSENTWGGKVALQYALADEQTLYGVASRGYKFGGFNPNNEVPAEFREYDAEYLTNYELGLKSVMAEGKIFSQVALFWQDRSDVQITNTFVECPSAGFPCVFNDYTGNASAGTTYGLEGQLDWQVTSTVKVFANLGLMHSEFTDFISYTHVDADPENNIGVDLDGHELPHAPSYTYTVGGEAQLTENLLLAMSLVGKDKFYFSNDHEYQSKAYQLLNARLSYDLGNWQLGLWGRNLTDKDYYVRGFGSFSNDPRDFYAEPELYVQYGEPRVVGISAEYQFK
ncbi:TonB-dependent receptor [Halioxenophilus sp. WMMB6]|uniref:TonB-dependent receptor n=1 Tax=Halioxenophilus sp. WMMB6 TaxID=3073815 RepID=UPI00295F4565|nr:TonB-dependent receptor [Halioxenophilus sp. WMMB6]